MATPLTEVRLLSNVDLDTTYLNTFSSKLFNTLEGQIAFFQAKSVHTLTELSFQRKERTIRVRKTYEQIEPLSYGMFKNGTTAKWYFFFITDIVYISEGVTDIVIEIDVEQTYLFDVALQDSFVEREHVSNDTIGEHRVNENLDVGEIVTQYFDLPQQLEDITFVLATTADSLGNDVVGQIVTGNYTGVAYYENHDFTFINSFITALTALGKADAIQHIFTMAKSLVNDDGTARVDQDVAETFTMLYTKPTTDIDGYTPKNNKLFTHPYNFMVVTNNKGAQNILKYEDSGDATMSFLVTGDVGPNPSVFLIPKNYKGDTLNYDESLTLDGYPVCSWTSDLYTQWLAQNQVSNAVAVGGSALSLGIGVATANPIAIASGALGVAGTIGGFYEKSILPNPAKGSITGAGNLAVGILNFGIYKRTITSEFARIIDNYFTKFGYKVNELKTPSITSRSRHNYLKLQECILQGNIPRESLKTMIENRTKGMTFWHIDDIGNYGPSN